MILYKMILGPNFASNEVDFIYLNKTNLSSLESLSSLGAGLLAVDGLEMTVAGRAVVRIT